MMAGLGPTGFVKKTFQELMTETKSQMVLVMGDGMSVDDSSPDVQEAGIMVEKYVELWDVMLQIFNSLNPTTTEGVLLDQINEGIRGIPRAGNLKSKVTCQLSGDAGTLIEAGALANQSTIGIDYELQADVTLDGSGDGIGVFICTVEGANEVLAGTFDTIVTTTVGWDTIANSTDGVKGSEVEKDPQYRVRANSAVALRSKSMIESLEAELISIQGMNQTKVYQNRTNSTDANGMVAKSIAVFCHGGIDQDIFDAIGRKVNFGPLILGDVSGYFADSRGVMHPVSFYRPAEIEISLEITVTEESGWILGAVKKMSDACVAYANGTTQYGNNPAGYEIGEKVKASDFYSAIQSVGGFTIDLVQVKRTVGGTYASSVVLDWDEIAILSFDNITVNH